MEQVKQDRELFERWAESMFPGIAKVRFDFIGESTQGIAGFMFFDHWTKAVSFVEREHAEADVRLNAWCAAESAAKQRQKVPRPE